MAAFPVFFLLAMFSGLLIIRTTAAENSSDTCSIMLHCRAIWCGGDDGCYCNQIMYLSSQTLVNLTVSYFSDSSEPFSVVWSRKGQIINQSNSFEIISTQNASTLKIKYDVNNGAEMEGFYTVTVSNRCGKNSTKTGIKFRCVYSPSPQILTRYSHVTPIAGNNLQIQAQIIVAEMANIHVCFTNYNKAINTSAHNFQDYYCVRCSTTLGSRCMSPLAEESIVYSHHFNVTNSYFFSDKNCSSIYTISFHKHHISNKDSGTVTFRVGVGTAIVNKTVSICVKPGHWKTMYLIGCSTAFGLGLLVSVAVYLCYCFRNKMKKPAYQSLPTSLPTSTISRSMSDVSNVFFTGIGGTEGTIIGTEGPGPDESIPNLLLTEHDPASII